MVTQGGIFSCLIRPLQPNDSRLLPKFTFGKQLSLCWSKNFLNKLAFLKSLLAK